MAYSNRGDYKEAVEEYSQAISIKPEMAEAHHWLAFAYYKLKEYELAERHIKKASELGFAIDKKLLKKIQKKLN